MSSIQQLFELGQAILSSVAVTLTLQMLFNMLYAHPRNSQILKRCCSFLRTHVSNFVVSGKHENFFYHRLVLPVLSKISPYSYNSCAALKTILTASSTEANSTSTIAADPQAGSPGASRSTSMLTIILDAKQTATLDIEATVDRMIPNQWIPHDHPVHAAANNLRSSFKNGVSSFESSLAAWVTARREMTSEKTALTPPSSTLWLNLSDCYSFGAETLMHFRFFKITTVVLIFSGLPLLYNVSILDVPFVASQNFSISDYNIAALPESSPPAKSTCFTYFALYLFPIWCDWCLGSICLPIACYNTSTSSGCKSGPNQAKDFWSDALTLGISPADCSQPFGTYMQSAGYCQCNSGYVGTVCRSGTPAGPAYGFFFMLATSVAFFAWIFMVRAREAVTLEIKQRLCPQVRDYSILIQDLPPNSHLNRNELCSFLSKKFGRVKFLSFAFDDRKLFDSKEALGACVEKLEELATSNFDYQSELIKNKILTQSEVAVADFEIAHDFECVKQWTYKRAPEDKPGLINSLCRLALPHPSIGFVLAPHFLYRMIYGPNIPASSEARGFPAVLKPKGASGPVQAPTSVRVGLVEYVKSFVLQPSASMVQWQALQAMQSILECQAQECQNSGTAIATFVLSSHKEIALRLNSRVACQARDEPSRQQSRYYVYQPSFTDVDQPEDVIWRNFGVSLFEKFYRFMASLFLCIMMIVVGSALFAVVTQTIKCRDPDFNSRHPTVCTRYGIAAASDQGDIYKSATEQFGGVVLSLYTSFTQLVSTFLAKKIETPSTKSQQVLFLIGREVFIALAILYCTVVMTDVAAGSPAFGYNKDWVKDQSKLLMAETITGIVTVTLSIVGPFPLRFTFGQALDFSIASNMKLQERAVEMSEYDIINVSQMIVKNTILCWILAGALPLYPIVTGCLLALSYLLIKSAQVYVLKPNSSCALAAPITMELFGILSPAIGIIAGALIWFPFSNANYIVFVLAGAAATLLGPLFIFILAVSFFKVPFDYQFFYLIPCIGRRGFRDVMFTPTNLVMGIEKTFPIYDVCGNLARRVFPSKNTCIDNTYSIFTFWRPRFYWYELIDSNPEFGFGKKQVVAMKVYKKDNKKTVDIIPTAHTGYHDDMDLTVDALRAGNANAIPFIQRFLPPNSKTGTVLASYQDTVNSLMVLNLSWPSKSFVESDTTVSGDLARHEMFPDGGIVANVPSIGDCVILLSQEEFHALELLPAVHSRSPTNRCEHVLSTMLEALSSRHDSTGFRGLPIDVFFNPDGGDASEVADSASPSPLKFTGWPNPSRMRDLCRALYGEPAAQQHSAEVQAPYLPNHADDFNPSAPACDERAAMLVRCNLLRFAVSLLAVAAMTFSLQEYVRANCLNGAKSSMNDAEFTVGPFRDDIAVVRDYGEIEEIELLNKVARGRGRAYSWFKGIKRFIIKLVQ